MGDLPVYGLEQFSVQISIVILGFFFLFLVFLFGSVRLVFHYNCVIKMHAFKHTNTHNYLQNYIKMQNTC